MDADGRPILSARVRAAPIDGAANTALERLLTEALGRPRSRVSVERGASSRIKTVEIEGVTEAEVEQRLAKPSPG